MTSELSQEDFRPNKRKWYKKWWGKLIIILSIWLLVMVIIITSFGTVIFSQVRKGVLDLSRESLLELPGQEQAQISLLARRKILETLDDPYDGSLEAEIVIVEFSDFQCSFCQEVFPAVREINSLYGDNIRFIYRDFPGSDIHPQALLAAQAGECAEDQGKFWPMHDKLFINQKNLSEDIMKEIAKQIGLNTEVFNNCLDTRKHQEEVVDDFKDGLTLGVTGTPTFFINGEKFEGVLSLDNFKQVINFYLEQVTKQ